MENQQILIIAGGLLLIMLVCYIIALVKSNRDEMVLTSNGWDMTLLLGCPILYMAGWCCGMEPPYNMFQIIVWGLSVGCLIGTIIFSIISNWGSFWKIVCSVLAKLFVVVLTIFIIFLLIVILIVSVILTLISNNEDKDEYILLKYDKFLKAYVGYKVEM